MTSVWDVITPLALVFIALAMFIAGLTAAGLELRGLVQRRPPSVEWFNFGCAAFWCLGCVVWSGFSRFASPFWRMNTDALDLANVTSVVTAAVWAIVALTRKFSMS